MEPVIVHLERERARRRAQGLAHAYRDLAVGLPPGSLYRDLVTWVAEHFRREAAALGDRADRSA